MRNNLDRLLQKRKQLEQQIISAQQLEKQKTRVHQIVISEFEKHDALLHADEQLLLASLATAFAEIANKCSPV